MFTFGKHRGETVEEVMENDQGYIEWALKTDIPEKHPALGEAMRKAMQELNKLIKIYDSYTEHCGPVYEKDEIIRNEPGNEPPYLCVEKVHEKFSRKNEDEDVFEDTWHITYFCRPATPEEYKTIAARDRALRRLSEIRNEIRSRGEKPAGTNNKPRGERLSIDPQTIYGTGEWFIFNENEIWDITNNGMDGDNWELNNIQTAGAGAIGIVLRDPEIAREVAEIAKIDPYFEHRENKEIAEVYAWMTRR